MIKREFFYLGWYLLLCAPIIILYIAFSIRAKKEWLTLIGQAKPEEDISEEEKRGYVRLETIFPVQFQIKGESEEKESAVHQGFTKNISKNGMCLESVVLRGQRLEELTPSQTKLRLIINEPPEYQAIITVATVRWVRKIEEGAIDRYLIGVSYDDMAEPDLAKITKYALWFRRRPDMLAFATITALVLIGAFLSTLLILKDTKSQLERRLGIEEEAKARLARDVESVRREKEELAKELALTAQRYTALQEKVRDLEKKRESEVKRLAEAEVKKEPLPPPKEIPPEEEEAPISGEEEVDVEEIKTEEAPEEAEPVVELRKPVSPEDEIVVKPNITRKMIESEKEVYNAFRDYILKEEVQLLDRYCSQHRTSIYHASSLFALAELLYKNRHIKETVIKAYGDVIKLYPKSKYASYASHRLDQIGRNLPYSSYSLRYFYAEYNLPPLLDYRELEPYKE